MRTLLILVCTAAVCTAISSLPCLATQGWAQEGSTAPPSEAPRSVRASESSRIEEIVVTGRRREERLQRTPVSITAFDTETLEARGLTQIDDLGKNVAGLKFDTTVGSNNTARIFIRGVGQGSESDELDPGVSLYVDGVYYSRLLGSVIPLLDLERVEVLRGPQGTLFGKNSVGGAILLTTRKPSSELGGRALARVGNLGLLETVTSIDVPLSETAFSRFSFATATDDGFVENLVDGEKTGDNKLLATRAALRFLPTDDVEANVTFERSREDEKSPIAECRRVPVLALSSGGVDNVALSRESCEASENATSEFKSFSNDTFKNELDVIGTTGSLSWDLGPLTLKAISSWREVANRDRGGDFDATSAEFLGRAPGKMKYDTVTHELLAQGKLLNDRLFITSGLYWLREEGRDKFEQTVQRNVIANPDIPLVGSFAEPGDQAAVNLSQLVLGQPVPTFRLLDLALRSPSPLAPTPLETLKNVNRLSFTRFETYTYAGFTDFTYELADGWSLTAGARYSEERKSRRRKSIPVFGPSFLPSGEIKPNTGFDSGSGAGRFDEWTSRATLAYQASDDVLLFAGFSNGFKSGGFDDSVVSDRFADVDPFDTETLDSYEVGVKSSWLSNRLRVNVTAFYNDYDDIQLSVMTLAQNGLPIINIQNAARAVVQGLELEMDARPSWLEGLALSVGVSFINADFKDFREDVVPQFTSDACSSLRLSECPLGDLGAIVGQLQNIRPLRNVDVSDREFSNTPPFSLNARAEYAFDIGAWGRVIPSIQWYHQADTFQDVRNTPGARQSKFGLLSGRLAWELPDGRTTVALFGRNLLDRRYITGSFDFTDQFASTQVFYGRPRTYGVEMIRTFGR
jgi:iron complex outermembrane recepter protein